MWPIKESSRRRLGVRHPVTGQFGVYLFLPPGLAAAPAINEQFMSEIVRVTTADMPAVVTRYVDDFRMVNSVRLSHDEDRALLNN